jgi:hypothetical protein
VLVGFISVGVLPAGVAMAQVREEVELIDAAGAIPVAALLGVAALLLARGARIRIERTLGRVGGAGTAVVGRVLGVLGLCIAAAGTIAVVTYYALVRYAE